MAFELDPDISTKAAHVVGRASVGAGASLAKATQARPRSPGSPRRRGQDVFQGQSSRSFLVPVLGLPWALSSGT